MSGSRDKEILSFIDDYWDDNWTSPTVREIGRAVGLASPASVAWHLSDLVRKGMLVRKELSGRRVLYRLTNDARTAVYGAIVYSLRDERQAREEVDP